MCHSLLTLPAKELPLGCVGGVGAVGVEAVPGVFFPRQKEGGGVLLEGGGDSHGSTPPLGGPASDARAGPSSPKMSVTVV